MAKYSKTDREKSIACLREWIKPGDTVYTILRHVSRSGMSREISVVLFKDGETIHPNFAVSRALGLTLKGDGVVMGGCGMDMGFALVYELSHALFPDGFTCTGEGCPSNNHSNGDRERTPHQHTNGGYALKQKWL